MERRRVPREISGETGAIIYGLDRSVNCTILNTSVMGACLEVAASTDVAAIPSEFSLFAKTKGSLRTCRVIWRSFQRMGVQFK